MDIMRTDVQGRFVGELRVRGIDGLNVLVDGAATDVSSVLCMFPGPEEGGEGVRRVSCRAQVSRRR